MKRLANAVTRYLLKEDVICQEKYEVYCFGMQIGIEIFINVLACFFIAYLLKMIPQCVFFFSVFIPLRAYAGGFHMNKYWKCFLLSICTLSIVLIWVKYANINSNIIFVSALFPLYYIYIIGPTGSKARALEIKEIKFFSVKLRKLCFGILILLVILRTFEISQYLLMLQSILWIMVGSMALCKKNSARKFDIIKSDYELFTIRKDLYYYGLNVISICVNCDTGVYRYLSV